MDHKHCVIICTRKLHDVQQAELCIGPLGHRVTLLEGIEELQGAVSAFVIDLGAKFAVARGRHPGGAASPGAAGRVGSRGAAGGGSRSASPVMVSEVWGKGSFVEGMAGMGSKAGQGGGDVVPISHMCRHNWAHACTHTQAQTLSPLCFVPRVQTGLAESWGRAATASPNLHIMP